MLSDDLEWWDGGGKGAQQGEVICIIMADLYYCTAEINITL